MQLTLAQLESLLRTLEAGGAGEFEYQDEKFRVKIAFGRPAAAAPAIQLRSSPIASAPVVAPVVEAAQASDLVAVTSPFVGTFYRAPSPEAQNFVEVGSTVKAGQALCIIEAMKLMNEIETDVAGTVVEVLVENGKSVEYGQKLFLIKNPVESALFKKVLIANRGEIAIRVIRACRELGIATVAVHSEADAGALHVRFADEAVCIGPPPSVLSYLNIPALISAAEITAADAIHPGYGFLSESVEFARIVEGCRLSFIGPRSDVMALWGDKLRARETARRFGLPLLLGSEALRDAEHAESEAARVGYPVMIKARGGGGGRGMRVVRSVEEVRRAFESATAESMSAFKNPELYLERFIERPRHVEFQALGDHHGQVWTLGERECSLQRRNQKLVEEAPSPNMTDELRTEMADLIRRAVSETGYTSLGTLEFLMDDSGKLFFMEMNTRVQVEHPVTEMTTGVDLVVEQIRAAAGEKLELGDTRPWRFRGHAIECRILAEDPLTFAPSPGKITEYHPPGGIGVRVDSGIFGGWTVPSQYDSLLAKVIAHAPTRELALGRMRRALDEFIVGGIRTNIDLHKRLLDLPEVKEGRMTTRTVETLMAGLRARS